MVTKMQKANSGIREELAKLHGVRQKFVGVFERYGTKTNFKGYPEQTLLFKNVADETGKIVCDHIWFTHTVGFDSLHPLSCGESIEFFARVKQYEKGYVNNRDYVDERETDYKLSHPTKIKKGSGSYATD